MGASSIEWTDATWNPVRGCTKISPGCKHCYAETFAERWRGIADHPYEQGFEPRFVPDQLGAPLRWRKPRRVFVNSMSDLFHDAFTNDQIAAVFGVMAACSWHTFQVLTKRAERMQRWFEWLNGAHATHVEPAQAVYCVDQAQRATPRMPSVNGFALRWPLPNVWLGVSAEDQRRADERIPYLIATPAAVRFVSVEPMLGPVDLTRASKVKHPDGRDEYWPWFETSLRLRGMPASSPTLSWVICGAESGNGARPMHEDWVRSLRDQCSEAGVQFFFKQKIDGRRKVSLPLLDGVQHAEWPAP